MFGELEGDGGPLLPSPDWLLRYRRAGFVRLGRRFGEPMLAGLRQRAEELMLGRWGTEPWFFQHDSATGRYADRPLRGGFVGPSHAYRKLEKLEHDDRFRAVIQSAVLAPVVRGVLGPDVRLYRATLFNKAPGRGSETPWHQDAGAYWGLDREPELQIWIALDDAPREAGCLEVVAGSHRAGLASPLGGVIARARLDDARVEAHALALPARAGEVIALHNLTWHRAGPNRTARPRRALSLSFLHGATCCTRRRSAPRRFWPVSFEG